VHQPAKGDARFITEKVEQPYHCGSH